MHFDCADLGEGLVMTIRSPKATNGVRKAKPPKKPRKSVKQNWTLYNLARAREAKDFMHLLAEITRMIPQEMTFEQENGRPRLSLSAVTYAMVFIRYFKLSQRAMGSARDEGLLLELYENGFIPQCLHSNSIGHHFRDARMTEVLEFLVELSALPLVAVERGDFETRMLPMAAFDPGDISIDCSVIAGAARTKKKKKGYRGQREHQVIKVHLTTGNRSNIVPACFIEEPGAHESPLTPGLVYTTAKSFEIGTVFGDRAYSTRRAYNAVEAVGGQGWFRFKKIHTGGSRRDAFARFYLGSNPTPRSFSKNISGGTTWRPHFRQSIGFY